MLFNRIIISNKKKNSQKFNGQPKIISLFNNLNILVSLSHFLKMM